MKTKEGTTIIIIEIIIKIKAVIDLNFKILRHYPSKCVNYFFSYLFYLQK